MTFRADPELYDQAFMDGEYAAVATSPTPFRDLVAQAYAAQQKDAAAREAMDFEARTSKARTKFIADFALDPDRVDGYRIETDGITLLLKVEDGRYYSWQVVGSCPDCGRECLSISVRHAAEVGAMLADFKPEGRHFSVCRSIGARRPPTLESRLADIIREFIAEATP